MTATMTKKKTAKKAAPKKATKKAAAKKTTGGLSTKLVFDYDAIKAGDATKLRKLASGLQDTGGRFVKNLVEMGGYLNAARDLCNERIKENPETGEAYSFNRWLISEAKMNHSTAYRYLSAYEQYADSPLIEHATASAIYLLCNINTPVDVKTAAERLTKGAKKGEIVITEAKVRELTAKHNKKLATHEVTNADVKASQQHLMAEVGLAIAPGTVIEQTPAAGEDTPPAQPASGVVDDRENVCPRGGDHDWQSDGNGARYCARCNATYNRREHGARISTSERKDVNDLLGKFVRKIQEIGAYDRVEPQLKALTAVVVTL